MQLTTLHYTYVPAPITKKSTSSCGSFSAAFFIISSVFIVNFGRMVHGMVFCEMFAPVFYTVMELCIVSSCFLKCSYLKNTNVINCKSCFAQLHMLE